MGNIIFIISVAHTEMLLAQFEHRFGCVADVTIIAVLAPLYFLYDGLSVAFQHHLPDAWIFKQHQICPHFGSIIQ